MAQLPALSELDDATNTVAQQKADFEDLNKAIKQLPGAPSGTASPTLTIASGSVTPGDGQAGIFLIDTEAAAATDDLANIVQTNTPAPSLLLIGLANAARVVVVKNSAGGAGQITLRTAGDFVLGDVNHWLLLKRTGTLWEELWRMPDAPIHVVLTKTANYTTTVADRNKVIEATSGTWTLTLLAAATAGKGFLQPVKNSGTGLITIDPNSSETVDGVTTIACAPGGAMILFCDGSKWISLGKGGALSGTNTNDAAGTGAVGEYVSSSVVIGSAVGLTNATPANITSISLTAGDWDVWGALSLTGNSSTLIQYYKGSISQTSATLDAASGRICAGSPLAAMLANTTQAHYAIAGTRISLSGTTTIYLVADVGFSVSTLSAYGIIQARRVR